MTPDGKLDRSALPQPHSWPARPPRNANEQAVEEACRAVLRETPSSVLDVGFAELGGDSLQAAQLSAALRTTVGRAVTAGHVLAATTLADLAAEITTLPAITAPVDERRVVDAVPLTPGQAGIRIAELTSTSPGAFHEAVAVELTGEVDPDQIARELTAVLNRHAVFLGRIDDATMQFVTDGAPLSVTVQPVAPDEAVDDAWQKALAALHRPAFDLGRGPLVRAVVLSAPHTVRLLLVWHHIVVDAWSARIVLEELAAALAGNTPRGPVEHGHAHYARRQRLYLASADGKLALQAAADRVRGWLPKGEGEARPAQESCQLQELSVGSQVWDKVRECARRNGTTTFAVTCGRELGCTHGSAPRARGHRRGAHDVEGALPRVDGRARPARRAVRRSIGHRLEPRPGDRLGGSGPYGAVPEGEPSGSALSVDRSAHRPRGARHVRTHRTSAGGAGQRGG
ncbi:condensation domain-containing protein [Streptomyces sp. NPDC051569]|uniref:condensation domain-containing protein n=1 Tax=Streptomyces sp. NPDC051569 TaxID=3365661 RepID=UPI0037B74314